MPCFSCCILSLVLCICSLQAIEVGQVGRLAASPAAANAPLKLYAHAQQGAGFGNSSSMLAALQAAAQGEASAAKVRRLTAAPAAAAAAWCCALGFHAVSTTVRGCHAFS
jgi:hypothetical protein